jgi:hypothetical protein
MIFKCILGFICCYWKTSLLGKNLRVYSANNMAAMSMVQSLINPVYNTLA